MLLQVTRWAEEFHLLLLRGLDDIGWPSFALSQLAQPMGMMYDQLIALLATLLTVVIKPSARVLPLFCAVPVRPGGHDDWLCILRAEPCR
jgi:hypothetical protein